MSRAAAKKYGPGGRYYRKRIRRPDGKYEDVYGLTQAELSEKVTVRQAQLAAEAAGTPADPYFYEYAAAWFSRAQGNYRPKYRAMVANQINKVICPVIGSKPLRQITSDDLKAVLATRQHLSRSSQQKTVLVLKQIFDAAYEAGAVDRLPARKLKAGGRPPKKRHALTEKQQATLLAAVHGLAVEPCVMLALYTGMRREEICALRWDEVEMEGKAPHITVHRACRWETGNKPTVEQLLKTDAAWRVIPIPPQLAAYLQQLLADRLAALQKRSTAKKAPFGKGGSGEAGGGSSPAQRILSQYVYADDAGGPVSLTAFRRRWETIKNRSTASGRPLGEKVRNKSYRISLDVYPTPHDLRHTYVTRLILGGVDLKRVQYLAGHSDPKVTLQIYTDLMGHAPEDLIDDVTAIFAPKKPPLEGEVSAQPAEG